MKKNALNIMMFALALCTCAIAHAETDQLVEKVKVALSAEPVLKGVELDVTNKDGTITLAGHPDTGAQLLKAANVTEKVSGVKFVINEMYPKDMNK
jgi:hyperosmotically inducible protein